MPKIIFSICSRSNKTPFSYLELQNWINDLSLNSPYKVYLETYYDADSIWDGHQNNIEKHSPEDNDIIVMCHDDIQIISSPQQFLKFATLLVNPESNRVGFLGVAGASKLDNPPIWWNARKEQESSGMVFQGDNMMTANINYFGPPHQVVALDGLFLMCRWEVLKPLLKKPDYLTSNWDFYDIHLTLSAHLEGYNNFAIPLIVMHESDGHMRPEWFVSLEEFSKHFRQHLPCKTAKGKLLWII